ncbi:hypothetical protein K443DRAFT_16164 [Laccaria amethystina LaAM-08-1]|uniref:Uncharacterized protein n=1 Tax=Laccaria amethystina LaAM-08-1 TaxID=1095629 RepID=A0A0C9WGG5_9AGAR|nr:hypothetical protein K443DRAFT_16164 [Laccaria amethystina LaAM-08-1]
MPRKSKAAKSRIENLGSKAQKKPSVTIEDVPDEDDFNCKPASLDLAQSDEGMYEEAFIVDEEDGSLTLVGFLNDFGEEHLPDLAHDLDSDDENDENPRDNYSEIEELSDLEQFSRILSEAQRIAVEAEDERLNENRRPKKYLKNSVRTKQRHKRIGKNLEKQGYLSIRTWFAKAKVAEGEASEVARGQNSESDVEMATVDENLENISAEEGNSVSLILWNAEVTVLLTKYY